MPIDNVPLNIDPGDKSVSVVLSSGEGGAGEWYANASGFIVIEEPVVEKMVLEIVSITVDGQRIYG